jgi:protein-tyrosine phosphatase
VASFGLATSKGLPAFPNSIRTAARLGIDLTEHRTNDISHFTFEDGDLILAMEIRQTRQLAAILAGTRAQLGLLGTWSNPRRPHIHDPHRLSDAYFRTCFSIIASAAAQLAVDLHKANAPAVRHAMRPS